MVSSLSANDMLDGDYKFRSTVKEANSNGQYSFRMNLNIKNNRITGNINYFNDNCSGTVSGKILSKTQLRLSETITKGADICDNGTYLYDLQYQIISKASHYILEDDKHSVIINQYTFTPEPKIWNNVILKDKISQIETDIGNLENQMIKPKELIKEAKKKKQQSQYYLDNNHSIYTDGQCIEPALETPPPDPLFDTREKAKKYALAYCSVSFGCRVGVELARDKLDTAAKRFLASQSCTLMVRTYQKQNTLLDETMFNLLDAVSYAGCSNDSDDIFSALVQGGSCIMSGATRLARVGQYMNCIDYKTKEFHNTYLDWKNAPKKKKTACDEDLKIVNETPKIIAKYNEEINTIQDKISTKHKQLQQLKNKLDKISSFRKKQSALIKQLKN